MKRHIERIKTRQKQRVRIFFLVLACLAISAACVLSYGGFGVSARESRDSEENIYTYYKSIEIQNGDTLWSIAEEAKPSESDSTADYVEILKQINGLDSDEIQAGQHLIISYETTDFIS